MSTNPQSMASFIAKDLTATATTSPMHWAQIAAKVYTSVTTARRKPLVDKKTKTKYLDKTYYDNLCDFYKTILNKPEIYPHWRLDVNGCPEEQPDFFKLSSELKERVRTLEHCDQSIALLTSSIIEGIAELFEALGYRHRPVFFGMGEWRNIRPDGVEVMFFSELARWLGMDLPLCNLKRPETAILIEQRIHYCTQVYKSVLIYRDDEKEINPKNQLERIIKALKVLHQDVIKANQAANFVDKIEQIDVACLSMAKHAFDMFYLLLNNGNHRLFHVDTFLSPQVHDVEVKQLREQLLGQWMLSTLEMAGIQSNNYKTYGTLELSRIATHLNEDYTHVLLSQTGLPSFACSDKTKGWHYLEHIRVLHRLLLKLYYVRESLGPAAQLGTRLGEIWLYGDATGREFVTALLETIDHAAGLFHNKTVEFWDLFYHQNFDKHSRSKHLDSTNTIYKRLTEADTAVAHIKELYTTIRQVLHQIQAVEFGPADKELTEKKKREVIHRVFAYMLAEGLNTRDYIRLNAVYASTSPATAISVPQVIDATQPLGYLGREQMLKLALPVYHIVKTALWSPFSNFSSLPLHFERPNKAPLCLPHYFASAFHKHLFTDFLHAYYGLSKQSIYIPSLRIAKEKRAEFQLFYYRVRAVLEYLYTHDSHTYPHPNLKIKDQFFVEQQLLAAMSHFYHYFYKDAHFNYLQSPFTAPNVLDDQSIFSLMLEHSPVVRTSATSSPPHSSSQDHCQAIIVELDQLKRTLLEKEMKIKELEPLITSQKETIMQTKYALEETEKLLEGKEAFIHDLLDEQVPEEISATAATPQIATLLNVHGFNRLQKSVSSGIPPLLMPKRRMTQ